MVMAGHIHFSLKKDGPQQIEPVVSNQSRHPGSMKRYGWYQGSTEFFSAKWR
ncbi:hypothetical protein ABIA40_000336 [Bradyrhizobium sp. USDA 223]